mmetsp:Transcript_68044/g.186477  ORF Transcript_68044/g.186477 Transcript_68044/m.186477 type:complete len:407 (-) Transcript_68044:238-1458(-)
MDETVVDPERDLAAQHVCADAHGGGEGGEAPRGLLAKVVQDGRVERRALHVLDGAVREDHVECDAAEGGLPHELARRLVVHKLLLEARHLALNQRRHLERLGVERRPAEARDDGRGEQLGGVVVEVLVDGLRDALRVGDVADHHLAALQRRVAEPLLELLEVELLLVGLVVGRRQQLLREHGAELVDKVGLLAVDVDEDREDVGRAARVGGAARVGLDGVGRPAEHRGLVALDLVDVDRLVVEARVLLQLGRAVARDGLEQVAVLRVGQRRDHLADGVGARLEVGPHRLGDRLEGDAARVEVAQRLDGLDVKLDDLGRVGAGAQHLGLEGVRERGDDAGVALRVLETLLEVGQGVQRLGEGLDDEEEFGGAQRRERLHAEEAEARLPLLEGGGGRRVGRGGLEDDA